MQKQKYVFTQGLYLSGEESREIISKCQVILDREKWSFNMLVKEALKEYEVRHGLGNNSFQLDKYGITWTKAQSMDKCGFRDCSKLAVGSGLFIPKNQIFGLCPEHFKVASGNSKVWSNLKYPKSDSCTAD